MTFTQPIVVSALGLLNSAGGALGRLCAFYSLLKPILPAKDFTLSQTLRIGCAIYFLHLRRFGLAQSRHVNKGRGNLRPHPRSQEPGAAKPC